MSTHNLCFEQKLKKKTSEFLSENFQFLVVKFSIYLNRRVFVMCSERVAGYYQASLGIQIVSCSC